MGIFFKNRTNLHEIYCFSQRGYENKAHDGLSVAPCVRGIRGLVAETDS
jgi:hypothetical protein